MSTSLHTSTEVARIEVFNLPDSKANVVKVEDGTRNEVAMFMSLEQMDELATKLKKYIKSQGGLK